MVKRNNIRYVFALITKKNAHEKLTATYLQINVSLLISALPTCGVLVRLSLRNMWLVTSCYKNSTTPTNYISLHPKSNALKLLFISHWNKFLLILYPTEIQGKLNIHPLMPCFKLSSAARTMMDDGMSSKKSFHSVLICMHVKFVMKKL